MGKVKDTESVKDYVIVAYAVLYLERRIEECEVGESVEVYKRQLNELRNYKYEEVSHGES